MNAIILIKKLLPGLLPLMMFIIADEIFDTKISLLIAILTGIVQYLWILLKEKRNDYFVVLDTGLVVILGGISFISNDEIFFKLKPGIIQSILTIMLLLIAYSPLKFLNLMLGRYKMDISLDEKNSLLFRKKLKIFSVILFLHTLLVFYSAFYLSKEAWAFISGVLFYIVILVYFVFEFIKAYYKKHNTEWLIHVKESGEVIGKISRNQAHSDKNLLHPVVHLHIFNSKRELFLQKRKNNKLVMPGKWDTSVGGHVTWGDTIEKALIRETKEEVGIMLEKVVFVKKYIWKSDIESELVYVFVTEWNKPIYINKKELDDGRFWTYNEITSSFHKDILTPNFEYEFQFIKKFFNKNNKIN